MARNDIKCEVSKSIMDEYSNIHLDIDMMLVNKVVYFTAISQHIRCVHYMAIKQRVKHRVSNTLKEIIKVYAKRGF